ncbi:MAG: TonB family protein [Acidobacteriaceae bacterium]
MLKSAGYQSEEEQASLPNGGLQLLSKPLVFGQPVPDGGVFSSLWANLHDTLFPEKQAPLRLTSRPIRVADPLAVRRSPASSVMAFCAHGLVLAFLLWLSFLPHPRPIEKKMVITHITFQPFIPPVTPPAPKSMGGGGGGGEHQIIEPMKGKVPPPQIQKLRVAPQIIRIDHPKLAVPAAIVMPKNLKMPDSNMPNVGMPQSPQVAMASQGEGSNGGFGSASGGGIGSGIGGGLGPGTGGGYGGGVMSVGGGVTAPQLIHSVEPEFTEQARAARLQGQVAIQLIVDANGNPEDMQVVHHLGMGLDEKAMEAVRQYRFQPAMFHGRAVPVRLIVEVNFHLF